MDSEAEHDVDFAADFIDELKTMLKTSDRKREWVVKCEKLLKQTESMLDPSTLSGKELLCQVGGALPEVLVEYMEVSRVCQESSCRVLQALAAEFDPSREMFTAFFEVISMHSHPGQLQLCLPLIRGLATIFPRIKRQTARFFRESMPGLIEVGRAAGQDDTDEQMTETNHDPDKITLQQKVIDELIRIAKVIQGICETNQDLKALRELLGVFTLQLLTVAHGSVSELDHKESQFVEDLLKLLSFSSLSSSLPALVTDVEKILDGTISEDDYKALESKLDAKRGVALAVYWEMQRGTTDDRITDTFDDPKSFRNPGRPLVLSVISITSTLLTMSCSQQSSMKLKGLGLMTSILEKFQDSTVDGLESEDDGVDLAAQIMPALQTLQDFIVFVPSHTLRRQGYGILTKIAKDVLPIRARFVTLRSLISNSAHPSLVSLLLTCVKDEVLKSWPRSEGGLDEMRNGAVETSTSSPFISEELLDIIHCVLRTKDGQPAELPMNLDAVLGALNLYRFILIKESTGSTNYTHVLSKEQLLKGRTYWLLPLREQVLRVLAAIRAENMDTSNHDVELGLDLLQSVVYRCLELVESQLTNNSH